MITTELAQRLEAAARGDDDAVRATAIGELLEALRRPLAGLCLRITCNPADAEDALQETAVDALRGVDSFRGEARLTTWLWRVAIRAALRLRARQQRRRQGQTDVDPDALSSRGQRPDEVAATSERTQRLFAAMQRLPAHQRTVLALSAIDGMAQTEIAEVLGIPVGTVHSRLHGARAQLQIELER